jgi:hypothetical protein
LCRIVGIARTKIPASNIRPKKLIINFFIGNLSSLCFYILAETVTTIRCHNELVRIIFGQGDFFKGYSRGVALTLLRVCDAMRWHLSA